MHRKTAIIGRIIAHVPAAVFIITVSLATLISSLLLGLAAALAVQLLADVRSPQVMAVTEKGGTYS